MAMMWWAQSWGWGGWLGMTLAMLVFWGAIVIWLIVSMTGSWSKPQAPSQRAAQVLADRFAAGDITAVDYQDRLRVLRGNPGGRLRRMHKNGAPK